MFSVELERFLKRLKRADHLTHVELHLQNVRGGLSVQVRGMKKGVPYGVQYGVNAEVLHTMRDNDWGALFDNLADQVEEMVEDLEELVEDHPQAQKP